MPNTPYKISKALDNSRIVTKLITIISKSTYDQLEKDIDTLKEKFIQTYPSIKFEHFVYSPDDYQEVSDEFREELKNVKYIKEIINKNFLIAQTNLSLLMVRSSINFSDEVDAKTAFFKCLPEYFNTEGFLKELLSETSSLNDFNAISVKSYIDDSSFVKENKVSSKVEEALMFFVGSQLVNDLFV